jgi:signal transduction histidine kinase
MAAQSDRCHCQRRAVRTGASGSNAAQASAGRPVRIAIERASLNAGQHKSHGRLDAGNYVVVSVADRGPGIGEAAKQKLFDPFFSTKPGGTELGLSTPWEIV